MEGCSNKLHKMCQVDLWVGVYCRNNKKNGEFYCHFQYKNPFQNKYFKTCRIQFPYFFPMCYPLHVWHFAWWWTLPPLAVQCWVLLPQFLTMLFLSGLMFLSSSVHLLTILRMELCPIQKILWLCLQCLLVMRVKNHRTSISVYHVHAKQNTPI